MVSFKAILQKFDQKGEKTGWTYFDIPAPIAQEIKPNTRTSFRVKGTLDAFPIKQVALVPMGEGDFIIAVNATMRKGIRKHEGATIEVSLEEDTSELEISSDLMTCLEEDENALDFFNSLTKGHQVYFSKWIESAKTIETKTKRISMAVIGLSMGLGYPETIRHFKNKNL